MAAPAPHLSVVKPNWFMDPNDQSLEAQKARADVHYANNQFEEALAICISLRNGDIKLAKSMKGQIDDTQIRCHLNLNQATEALALLKDKLSPNRASTPPNLLRMFAEAHYQLRHARECVDVYFDIVTRDPADARNWRDLGQIFEDFGLFRLKSICFHRALELAERQRASRRSQSGSEHFLSEDADDELLQSIQAGLESGPPSVSVETLAASSPEVAAFIANEEAYVKRVEELLAKTAKQSDDSVKVTGDQNMVPDRSEVVATSYDAALLPPSTPAPTVSEFAASRAAAADAAAAGSSSAEDTKDKSSNGSLFKRFEMSFAKKFSKSRTASGGKRASKRERNEGEEQGEVGERTKANSRKSLFSPKKNKRRSEAPPPPFALTPSQQAKANIASGLAEQPKKKRLQKLAQKIKNVRKKPGDIPQLVPMSPGRVVKRPRRDTQPPAAPWWQPSRATLRNALVVAGVAATVSVIALYARSRSQSSGTATSGRAISAARATADALSFVN